MTVKDRLDRRSWLGSRLMLLRSGLRAGILPLSPPWFPVAPLVQSSRLWPPNLACLSSHQFPSSKPDAGQSKPRDTQNVPWEGMGSNLKPQEQYPSGARFQHPLQEALSTMLNFL